MFSFLSPLLCGFREGYSTQHALLLLKESRNKSIDSAGIAGAVLIDLSKAFDCLDHELLIAELNAYGFTTSALLFVHSYLGSRKQRIRVNCFVQYVEKNLAGRTTSFCLGTTFVYIYLNGLFLFLEETDICNYADDTTIYTCGPNVENEDKCHLMVFGGESNEVSLKIGEANEKESKEEKLLGINFDHTLSFKQHVKTLARKPVKNFMPLPEYPATWKQKS